jgi:hypothetical protein
VTIAGPDEFKQVCAQLAAQHGFRISNPELHPVAVHGPSVRQPLPTIPAASPSPSAAYQMHKADILNRIEVRNPSQLDWMIAARMRVTGHDQQAIALALKENASQGRAAENRNWRNYAERTAEAVFGPRGDRECAEANSARKHGRGSKVETLRTNACRNLPESAQLKSGAGETLRSNEIALARRPSRCSRTETVEWDA